ncbi:MAG: acyl carrier protein, partial [Pseudomonadota bacterium]
ASVSLGAAEGAAVGAAGRLPAASPAKKRCSSPLGAAAERLIGRGTAQAVVSRIDWAQFLAAAPKGLEQRFFAGLAAGSRPAAPTAAPSAAPSETLADRLRGLPAGARAGALTEALAARTRTAIGLDPATPIPPDRALKEMGLDSLMAVELRNMLVRDGGHPLPATLLFDHPTLDRLAARLTEVWSLAPEPAAAAEANGTQGTVADEIDALDEAEALTLLEQELAEDAGRERAP